MAVIGTRLTGTVKLISITVVALECWNALLVSLCLGLLCWYAVQASVWLDGLRVLWSLSQVWWESISSAVGVEGLGKGLGCGQGMHLWVAG